MAKNARNLWRKLESTKVHWQWQWHWQPQWHGGSQAEGHAPESESESESPELRPFNLSFDPRVVELSAVGVAAAA
jgi:hypothetical protein